MPKSASSRKELEIIVRHIALCFSNQAVPYLQAVIRVLTEQSAKHLGSMMINAAAWPSMVCFAFLCLLMK
jgi:hypothetical protein